MAIIQDTPFVFIYGLSNTNIKFEQSLFTTLCGLVSLSCSLHLWKTKIELWMASHLFFLYERHMLHQQGSSFYNRASQVVGDLIISESSNNLI